MIKNIGSKCVRCKGHPCFVCFVFKTTELVSQGFRYINKVIKPSVPVRYAKKLMTFKERNREQDKETNSMALEGRQDRFLRLCDRAVNTENVLELLV